MLPGLTTIASSHMAYLTEQKVQQKTYKKGNTYCITSSETANNAGSISQLFPLLMFGIPISGSEAIIWSLLDIKGWENSPNEVIKLVTEHWYILLTINLIALTLAIRFARHFIKIVPKNANLLKLIIFLILCVVTYTVGEKLQGYGYFSLFCFVFTTLIAWKTPRVSYIPFIFWLVIGPILLDSFYTALMVHGIYGA
jgi:TctA family transporter